MPENSCDSPIICMVFIYSNTFTSGGNLGNFIDEGGNREHENVNGDNNVGRIALIRFKSEQDALKIYHNRNNFYLPLIEYKKGNPHFVVGKLLLDFIENNQF